MRLTKSFWAQSVTATWSQSWKGLGANGELWLPRPRRYERAHNFSSAVAQKRPRPLFCRRRARPRVWMCVRAWREKEIFVTLSVYVSGRVFVILCVPSDEYRCEARSVEHNHVKISGAQVHLTLQYPETGFNQYTCHEKAPLLCLLHACSGVPLPRGYISIQILSNMTVSLLTVSAKFYI